MLQILPSWYPIVRLAAIVLFEVGEGLVEVVSIDIGEDLPQYLAIFELVQSGNSVGEVESVDLEYDCQSQYSGIMLVEFTQSRRAFNSSGLKSSMLRFRGAQLPASTLLNASIWPVKFEQTAVHYENWLYRGLAGGGRAPPYTGCSLLSTCRRVGEVGDPPLS
jgi:hypothetical protein